MRLVRSFTVGFIIFIATFSYLIWELNARDYYYYYDYCYVIQFASSAFSFSSLLFANFVHGTVSHLVNNLIAIAIAGFFLENHFSNKNIFLIAIVSGISAFFISSFVLLDGVSMCGASACAFALYGGAFYVALKTKSNYMWFIFVPTLLEILSCIPLSREILSTNNTPHLVGFCFGFFIASQVEMKKL